MTASQWEIEYYETRSGRCPTQEFLDSLESKVIDRASANREEYLRRSR